jgi:hypothetical protein
MFSVLRTLAKGIMTHIDNPGKAQGQSIPACIRGVFHKGLRNAYRLVLVHVMSDEPQHRYAP